MKWSYYQKDVNQMLFKQLSKANLYQYLRLLFEFCWMWIFPWIKLSCNSCSMWNKLTWLNWFWQFLCKGLSFFNPKGFCWTHMHVLAVYVKEGFLLNRDLSLEKSANFYLYFRLVYFTNFIFLYDYLLHFYAVFDSILSNIDVLSINPFTNAFVFGEFNVHHQD